MNGVYLGIGGNQGDRANNLGQAIKLIEQKIGIVVRQSFIYETAPWGNTKQSNFYNQVLFVKSKLDAPTLMQMCLEIEKNLGRERKRKWAERTMDIDILFYNDEILKTKNLVVPHPRITERNFVLIPMNEIAPHYIHPVFRKKIFTLLRNSEDQLAVKKINKKSA